MSKSYKRARREAYPTVGQQLDAIWKCLNQMRLNGTDLPADADAMLNRVLAVKKAHPKPERRT